MSSCVEAPSISERVRCELEARCGADRLWTVERLSKHIFRAWLTNGANVVAMLLEDGSVKTWEMEA